MEEFEINPLRNDLENAKIHAQEKENFENLWGTYDSPLLGEAKQYETSCDAVFRDLYPSRYENIKDYIQDRLATKRGSAVGVEIGGPGSRIFSQFDQGFFAHSIGITLKDIRSEAQKKVDEVSHHEILATNIISSQGYHTLKNRLQSDNQRVNLLLEKMHAGFHLVPKSMQLWLATFCRWYRLLDDEAIMFIQLFEIENLKTSKQPGASKIVDRVTEWIEKLDKVPGIKAVAKQQEDPDGAAFNSLLLKIEKNKEAPDDIPKELSDFE